MQGYEANAGRGTAALFFSLLLTLIFSPSSSAQTPPVLPAATCNLYPLTGLQGSCGSSFLQTSVTSSVTGNLSGVTSSFDYYFSINSASNPTINVQVNYAADAIAIAINDPYLLPDVDHCFPSSASSQASISIQTNGNSIWGDTVESNVDRVRDHCGSSSQGLWLNEVQQPVTIQLNTNTTYMVLLQSTQQIACGGPATACYAWAYVDPQITVDPTVYPDATVSFSDGVINATTPSATIDAMGQSFLTTNLPDTSTDGPIPSWALGVLGAGLLGIASRRLKQSRVILR